MHFKSWPLAALLVLASTPHLAAEEMLWGVAIIKITDLTHENVVIAEAITHINLRVDDLIFNARECYRSQVPGAPSRANIAVAFVDDQNNRIPLAQATLERFRLPFRLLLLPSNLGFARASNCGLRAARSPFVCFLNSDIFPIDDDWIERLVVRLEQNPGLGVIGARLLYEDGSIQHEGCYYRPQAEFGGWTFIEHTNKGRRPAAARGLQYCEAITGACMVLARSLAQELGGFDESYVVGDFEDSDLCRRVQARGLKVAVDDDR